MQDKTHDQTQEVNPLTKPSTVINNKPISCAELVQVFPELFVEIIGDPARSFTNVASPDSAKIDSALFLATPKALGAGLTAECSVWVVGPKSKTEAEQKRDGRTVIIAKNVERAMASTINKFFLSTPYTNRAIRDIHPSAQISPSAEIGAGVRIGPNVFIGSSVRIMANVYIGANSVIEDDAFIDEGTVIHPLVFIGHSTVIGKRCEVHANSVVGKEGYGYVHDENFNHFRIPHQGKVILEDEVHLGGCCTIDRGTFNDTRIERGAKLDNQVHIAHNCKVGRNSLLTAQFAAAGSSKMGANFVVGGKTSVSGHIEVCDNVQLAALSAVTRDVTEPGQYGGVPVIPMQQFLKARLAYTQLPEMRKQLKKVLKKLGLEEEDSKQQESEA